MNNKDFYNIGFFGTIIWTIILFFTMLNQNTSDEELIGYLVSFLVTFSTIYYLHKISNNKEIDNVINKTEYENQILEKKIEQKKLIQELEKLKQND